MRSPLLLGALALLLLAAPIGPAKEVRAEEAPPAQKGDTITWVTDVPAAFEKAVKLKKPVMICINSRRVDGGKLEPAAKGLREIIYKDPRVVTKSRKFVCVFLTSEGSSNDYGELRLRFGIDGFIVSPQHVFAHPEHKNGESPLFRKEYWPYGSGEAAVEALIGMMDKAMAAFGGREGAPEGPPTSGGEGAPDSDTPAPEPQGDPAPADDDERTAWIQKTLRIVRSPVRAKRREALRLLVTSDKDGDCITPLLALMPALEKEKAIAVLTDVVRALGRPKLDAAAETIAGYLKHKDEELRANAAVSLEYIGCAESVAPLMARVKREKVEIIANHMYRALGRCGVGDAKVRTLLAKKSKGGKTESAAFGPIVGLAYFEGDAKAARAAEKLLKQIGPPAGGRGGWRNNMKRGMLGWAIAEIRDPKSEAFIRKEMLEPIARSEGRLARFALGYYEAIAKYCGGDDDAKDAIDTGIRGALEWAGGTEKFRDDARKERDISQFEPKADWEVAGRDWGGGRGDRGGGGRKR